MYLWGLWKRFVSKSYQIYLRWIMLTIKITASRRERYGCCMIRIEAGNNYRGDQNANFHETSCVKSTVEYNCCETVYYNFSRRHLIPTLRISNRQTIWNDFTKRVIGPGGWLNTSLDLRVLIGRYINASGRVPNHPVLSHSGSRSNPLSLSIYTLWITPC